jgi:hypothetical protein
MTEELSELQLSNTTSPDEMSPSAPTEQREKEPERETVSEKERNPSIGHSSLHRKMLASHLHIPSLHHGTTSKPNSVRRLGTGASSTPGG